ncbi:OmpA family protein [Antarcticimicrobium sediminis]|nr:OmpA family protein [Antarcticimicrobium sediminis]
MVPVFASIFAVALALAFVPAARAQGVQPFVGGWHLDPAASELRFLSIKNGDLAEANRFDTISGLITDQGKAQIRVLLDSVDTGVDLRNVRLRFMLFESFQHPEAVITAQLDAALLRDLPALTRKEIDLSYALSLHGMTLSNHARVSVALLGEDRVEVASVAPIPVSAAKLGMAQGIATMEQAAGVSIVPVGIVSFTLVFERGSPDAPNTAADTASAPQATAPSAAGRAGCADSLAEASRAGGIQFSPGSTRLRANSGPALDRVAEIAKGCAGLRLLIAGHTDSDGAAQANLRLSRARADAVAAALATRGIARSRLQTRGLGEAEPLVPNSTPANKARNRRIEFTLAE